MQKVYKISVNSLPSTSLGYEQMRLLLFPASCPFKCRIQLDPICRRSQQADCFHHTGIIFCRDHGYIFFSTADDDDGFLIVNDQVVKISLLRHSLFYGDSFCQIFSQDIFYKTNSIQILFVLNGFFFSSPQREMVLPLYYAENGGSSSKPRQHHLFQ
jgi:hypothetical protein